jgi:hypothetical protein
MGPIGFESLTAALKPLLIHVKHVIGERHSCPGPKYSYRCCPDRLGGTIEGLLLTANALDLIPDGHEFGKGLRGEVRNEPCAVTQRTGLML